MGKYELRVGLERGEEGGKIRSSITWLSFRVEKGEEGEKERMVCLTEKDRVGRWCWIGSAQERL